MLVFMSPTVVFSEVLFLMYAQNFFGLNFAALATSICSSLWQAYASSALKFTN